MFWKFSSLLYFFLICFEFSRHQTQALRLLKTVMYKNIRIPSDPTLQACDKLGNIAVNNALAFSVAPCLKLCEDLGNVCAAFSEEDGKCMIHDYLISPVLLESNQTGTKEIFMKQSKVDPAPYLMKDVSTGKVARGTTSPGYSPANSVVSEIRCQNDPKGCWCSETILTIPIPPLPIDNDLLVDLQETFNIKKIVVTLGLQDYPYYNLFDLHIGNAGNVSDKRVTFFFAFNKPGEKIEHKVDNEGRFIFFNVYGEASFCLCSLQVYADL